jgi:hypothetical protein
VTCGLSIGAARALLVLAPLLGVAASGRAAQATPMPLERQLESSLGGVPRDLGEALDALRRRNVPIDLLERRLHEGLAKGVPPRGIGDALARMAVSLLWTEDQLAGCTTPAARAARGVLRDLSTDLLVAGVDRRALAPLLARACTLEDPSAWAATAGELYFFLVNKLGAARDQAWAATAAASVLPDAHQGIAALVACLHDIQRSRGSVDRALEIAIRRTSAGTPLRRVRLELEEQFLR